MPTASPTSIMILTANKSDRFDTLVINAIENSDENIRLSEHVSAAFDKLHRFMFEKVYTNPICKGEESKAIELVQMLFQHYCKHPDEMPLFYADIARAEGAERGACDYIAGMSDRFAKNAYMNIFVPKSWEE